MCPGALQPASAHAERTGSALAAAPHPHTAARLPTPAFPQCGAACPATAIVCPWCSAPRVDGGGAGVGAAAPPAAVPATGPGEAASEDAALDAEAAGVLLAALTAAPAAPMAMGSAAVVVPFHVSNASYRLDSATGFFTDDGARVHYDPRCRRYLHEPSNSYWQWDETAGAFAPWSPPAPSGPPPREALLHAAVASLPDFSDAVRAAAAAAATTTASTTAASTIAITTATSAQNAATAPPLPAAVAEALLPADAALFAHDGDRHICRVRGETSPCACPTGAPPSAPPACMDSRARMPQRPPSHNPPSCASPRALLRRHAQLCRRQFRSADMLARHAAESALHRTNLAALEAARAAAGQPGGQ